MDAVSKRAAALGASKDDVVQVDAKTVSVRLPGYKKTSQCSADHGEKGLLEFKLVDSKRPPRGGQMPPVKRSSTR